MQLEAQHLWPIIGHLAHEHLEAEMVQTAGPVPASSLLPHVASCLQHPSIQLHLYHSFVIQAIVVATCLRTC
jgi:hypothetical protein